MVFPGLLASLLPIQFCSVPAGVLRDADEPEPSPALSTNCHKVNAPRAGAHRPGAGCVSQLLSTPVTQSDKEQLCQTKPRQAVSRDGNVGSQCSSQRASTIPSQRSAHRQAANTPASLGHCLVATGRCGATGIPAAPGHRAGQCTAGSPSCRIRHLTRGHLTASRPHSWMGAHGEGGIAKEAPPPWALGSLSIQPGHGQAVLPWSVQKTLKVGLLRPWEIRTH